MSYYVDQDGLRCDRCRGKRVIIAEYTNWRGEQFCDHCWDEYRADQRSFLLTWLLVGVILTGALWVLYSLPPTFD